MIPRKALFKIIFTVHPTTFLVASTIPYSDIPVGTGNFNMNGISTKFPRESIMHCELIFDNYDF